MQPDSYLIKIRRATSADEQNLIQLQCRAISILATSDYRPRQIKALLRSKSKPRWASEITLIAEIAGSIVGFAALLSSYRTISAVFVEPHFTHQGIGSLLLQSLEREAISHQVTVLWVSSSLTGRNFYRVNGYSPVETITLVLESSYIPCVRMKKRLLPISRAEIIRELIQLSNALLLICLVIAFFESVAAIATLFW
ncbi:MAG: GNAT family N-acetyltransferase [Cyanobacteria bacterium J06623_7]